MIEDLREFGGTRTEGVKKTHPAADVVSIVFNDMKTMRNITFTFRTQDGKNELLAVFSHATKNFDQIGQIARSYYGHAIQSR